MNYVLSPSAVQKIRRAITPKLGSGDHPSSSPAAVSFDLFPAPFTVRWAASLASPESSEGAGDATAGEWIIYLPTTGLCLVGGTSLDLTSALTAAGGDYPTGWYKLLDDEDQSILSRSTGGTLFLNISAAATPAAAFDSASAAGATSIKIAIAAVNSTTGARTVKQLVRSSIVIGGIGGGGLPASYDIITDSTGTGGAARTHFTNRYFEVSGVIREGPDVSGSLTDSAYAEKWIAIQLTGSASGYTQTIAAYPALSVLVELAENQNYVIIPLYKLNSTGGVEIDLRRIPRADMWSVYI